MAIYVASRSAQLSPQVRRVLDALAEGAPWPSSRQDDPAPMTQERARGSRMYFGALSSRGIVGKRAYSASKQDVTVPTIAPSWKRGGAV